MNASKLSSLRGPNPLAHNSALAVAPSRRSHRLCAAKRETLTVLVDVDAVVQGLAPLSTAWAFSAASATTDIAGSPSVYTSYMQQLMPVVHQPYEAALLLRLLHDEGIVGARSTAGREGPVVGRPVRQSGSRPLLLNEILEHWADEIKPTCLLRWSRQAGCSCTQLEQQVKQAYEQAQRSVDWEVLDMQQQQHGSSRSSSQSSSNPSRQHHTAAAVAAPEPPVARNPAAAGTAVSTAAVQCAADPLLGAISPDAASVSVTAQPYVSIVPCLQHCPAQVYVASTYPLAITQAVLSAVQLQGVQVLCGSSMQHCLQQLPPPPPLLQEQQPPGSAVSSPSNRQLVVVLSSPSKAPEEQSVLGTAAGQQQQQQQQQQQLLEPHAPFQVAEWACKAPSLRAKALSGQGLGLLSEWGLAELLGADSSDAVMDGIAWRS